MAGPRFNTKGKRVKKKPQIKMRSTGRAVPGEKTLNVNTPPNTTPTDKKERIKIVPGFKGLIKKRKELIN